MTSTTAGPPSSGEKGGTGHHPPQGQQPPSPMAMSHVRYAYGGPVQPGMVKMTSTTAEPPSNGEKGGTGHHPPQGQQPPSPMAMSHVRYGGPVQPGYPPVAYAPVPVHQGAPYTTEPSWHWCNLITAIVSFFLCYLFGLIATVFAILAYVDHKAKDFGRSESKRKLAWGFGIAGIVLGVITFVIVLIVILVAVPEDDEIGDYN